jgi:serine protease Do
MHTIQSAFSRAACAAFACALLLASCSPAGEPTVARPPVKFGVAAPPAPAAPSGAPTGLPDFSQLVERDGPTVVNVTTTRAARASAGGVAGALPDDPLFDFFRRFLPQPDPDESDGPMQGLGSGFIISQDGYILTNAHVVLDADEVTVRLSDAKREFKAKVIGVDKRTDVALLKVEATGLPVVRLGNSETLKVGEWVAAIGSPFGFANTITAGIVSAKGRSLPDESFVPFIQTDVAVNPGNSGGPLLNLRGEVVGINSMIYSRTGGYMGVSFAIPIEVAVDVAQQLQTQGKVTRGRLGVQIQELTLELAKSFGLESASGVVVAGVDADGPAAKAGLVPGDVILKFNDKVISSAEELPRLVAATKPGAKATIEIWRKGARREIALQIGEFPAEPAAQKPVSTPNPPNRLGLVVGELPPAQRKALGIDYGVVVERVDAPTAAAQLRRGDVIIAVNETRFTSLKQFNELLAQPKPDSYVALLVRRGPATIYVPIRVGAAK